MIRDTWGIYVCVNYQRFPYSLHKHAIVLPASRSNLGVDYPRVCNLPCVMIFPNTFKTLIDFSGFCGSENRLFRKKQNRFFRIGFAKFPGEYLNYSFVVYSY